MIKDVAYRRNLNVENKEAVIEAIVNNANPNYKREDHIKYDFLHSLKKVLMVGLVETTEEKPIEFPKPEVEESEAEVEAESEVESEP